MLEELYRQVTIRAQTSLKGTVPWEAERDVEIAMFLPPPWKVCSTTKVVAAGHSQGTSPPVRMEPCTTCLFREAPVTESAPGPPTHHGHFGVIQAGTLRPSTPALAWHIWSYRFVAAVVPIFPLLLAVGIHGRSGIIPLFHHLYFECYH